MQSYFVLSGEDKGLTEILHNSALFVRTFSKNDSTELMSLELFMSY